MTKPWVNYYLRTEIFQKYKLKGLAGRTKFQEDINRYNAQCEKVDEFTGHAQEAYFRRNPGQESVWLPILAREAVRQSYQCDICDMFFNSKQEYDTHVSEHQVCGLDECTFTAHPKALEVHILHLHASGLYSRIERSMTKEAIEKWQNDRRK
jgi:hypothetical protein